MFDILYTYSRTMEFKIEKEMQNFKWKIWFGKAIRIIKMEDAGFVIFAGQYMIVQKIGIQLLLGVWNVERIGDKIKKRILLLTILICLLFISACFFVVNTIMINDNSFSSINYEEKKNNLHYEKLINEIQKPTIEEIIFILWQKKNDIL